MFRRFGIDFVRLARDGSGYADVVVQTGRTGQTPDGQQSVEVLAGVNAGDRLVLP
ncbi:MAG: hypothetical protein JNL44_16565 [Gemmatimonadetes bacterium]|nr:hypothetical protein [Gemmatimonadota bacterium]